MIPPLITMPRANKVNSIIHRKLEYEGDPPPLVRIRSTPYPFHKQSPANDRNQDADSISVQAQSVGGKGDQEEEDRQVKGSVPTYPVNIAINMSRKSREIGQQGVSSRSEIMHLSGSNNNKIKNDEESRFEQLEDSFDEGNQFLVNPCIEGWNQIAPSFQSAPESFQPKQQEIKPCYNSPKPRRVLQQHSVAAMTQELYNYIITNQNYQRLTPNFFQVESQEVILRSVLTRPNKRAEYLVYLQQLQEKLMMQGKEIELQQLDRREDIIGHKNSKINSPSSKKHSSSIASLQLHFGDSPARNKNKSKSLTKCNKVMKNLGILATLLVKLAGKTSQVHIKHHADAREQSPTKQEAMEGSYTSRTSRTQLIRGQVESQRDAFQDSRSVLEIGARKSNTQKKTQHIKIVTNEDEQGEDEDQDGDSMIGTQKILNSSSKITHIQFQEPEESHSAGIKEKNSKIKELRAILERKQHEIEQVKYHYDHIISNIVRAISNLQEKQTNKKNQHEQKDLFNEMIGRNSRKTGQEGQGMGPDWRVSNAITFMGKTDSVVEEPSEQKSLNPRKHRLQSQIPSQD